MNSVRGAGGVAKKIGWTLCALFFLSCGPKTTRIKVPGLSGQVLEADLEELISRVSRVSGGFQTLKAKVELTPTAGSIYSGVIKEYRDVRAFILLEKPSRFRIIGQAPVLRSKIFDMVSDGENFGVYIPPKRKYIVGKNSIRRETKNKLEGLRPHHILTALLLKEIDPNTEKCFIEESLEGPRRYYVVHVVSSGPDGGIRLERKIWFDRSDLEIKRVQRFGPDGAYLQDVRYDAYQDFNGTRYPTKIDLIRPKEDYRLGILFQEVSFNEPMGPEKFVLDPPKSVEKVVLKEESSEDVGDR